MKKAILMVIILVLALGCGVVWYYSHNMPVGDDVVEDEQSTVTVDGKEYYEAEYPDGSDANSLEGLTYTLPEGFTGILSEDDSVQENLYINQSNGTKLSISLRTGDSAADYEALGNEYLDGAADVEEFTVGGKKAYKYRLYQESEIIECEFFILDGDRFYAGLLFHPEDVDNERADEPDPIPLTEDEIAGFDALCESLNL